VALRISEIEQGTGTTLKVDGRLSGSEVGELARAGASCAGPVTLDLSGLLFADDDGVSVLRDLQAHGADLRNVPTYISLLLELESIAAASTLGSGRAG
jgi:ABC-type transporter Mla MlaB component